MKVNVRGVLRVYNEDMLQARQALGLSLAELAQKSGVPISAIGYTEKFMFAGNGAPETWEKRAIKIAKVLKVPVDTLVPPDLIDKNLKPLVSVERLNTDRLLSFANPTIQRLTHDPEQEAESGIVREELDKMLKELPPTLESVLRKLHGIGCEQQSMKEIAEEEGLHVTTIKHRKDSALAKLVRSGPRNRNKLIRMFNALMEGR